jgi:hypothetical protein
MKSKMKSLSKVNVINDHPVVVPLHITEKNSYVRERNVALDKKTPDESLADSPQMPAVISLI